MSRKKNASKIQLKSISCCVFFLSFSFGLFLFYFNQIPAGFVSSLFISLHRLLPHTYRSFHLILHVAILIKNYHSFSLNSLVVSCCYTAERVTFIIHNEKKRMNEYIIVSSSVIEYPIFRI